MNLILPRECLPVATAGELRADATPTWWRDAALESESDEGPGGSPAMRSLALAVALVAALAGVAAALPLV